MDIENNSSVQAPQKPAPKTKKGKSWLPWLLAVIVLGAAAGYLGLLLNTSSNQKSVLEAEVKDLKQQLEADNTKLNASNTATEEVACSNIPSDTMKENIKAALDSKNTAAFATYFTNPVNFVLAASEKGGDETPDQAAASMDYANTATGPWDFSLPQATLDIYAAGGYKAYFNDHTYVGKADSSHVAAFNFDCNGKIKQVFISPSDDLLM